MKKAQWDLTHYCNFNCEYCYNKERSIDFQDKHKSIDGAVAFFDSTSPWEIILGGGEPFLFPKFIELCEKLTLKNYISIVTNLSCSVSDFCSRVNPTKVKGISISAHATQRPGYRSLNTLVSKIHELELNGFPFDVSQVMYPPLIKTFEELYSFFENHRICLIPKPFEGEFEGKIYPGAYTKEEKDFIDLFLSRSQSSGTAPKKVDEILKFQGSVFSFKDKTCSSGFDNIVILRNGDVVRCWSLKNSTGKSMGNIYQGNVRLYKKPSICNEEVCICPQMGFNCLDE